MQPSGDSFIKQFSLDWLPGVRAQRADNARQAAQPVVAGVMEEALLAFAQPLLKLIAGQPERKARLFDLLDGLEKNAPGSVPNIDSLRTVIRALESRGTVRIVEHDRHGNDTIALTAA